MGATGNVGGEFTSVFLSAQPAARVTQTYQLAAAIAADLAPWAHASPLLRGSRTGAIALTIAAVAPYAATAQLLPVAKVCHWAFALDDYLDEAPGPPAALALALAPLVIALQADTAIPVDPPLAALFAEIEGELARNALFTPLRTYWRAGCRRLIRAMLREARWRAPERHRTGTPLPSYRSYLATGRSSVGLVLVGRALLIALDDPAILTRLSQFGRLERTGMLALRLANDLRSAAREREEGKPNALVLLATEAQRQGYLGAAADNQARRIVEDTLTHALAALGPARDHVCTPHGEAESAVADLVRFVCDFYRAEDYHTTSL